MTDENAKYRVEVRNRDSKNLHSTHTVYAPDADAAVEEIYRRIEAPSGQEESMRLPHYEQRHHFELVATEIEDPTIRVTPVRDETPEPNRGEFS